MATPDGPGKQLVAPGAKSSKSQGTFTYTGDPSNSDLDAVRFLVGDTDPSAYFLNDAEIGYLIGLSASLDSSNAEVNVSAAAGAAAEAIAAELSREVSYSADGVSVSADTLANKYYSVAEKIRTLSRRSDVTAAPDVGGLLVGEVYDPSIRPLVFAVGMHDNYLGGQQDFGGAYLPPGSAEWYGSYGAVAAEATALRAQVQALLGQQ